MSVKKSLSFLLLLFCHCVGNAQTETQKLNAMTAMRSKWRSFLVESSGQTYNAADAIQFYGQRSTANPRTTIFTDKTFPSIDGKKRTGDLTVTFRRLVVIAKAVYINAAGNTVYSDATLNAQYKAFLLDALLWLDANWYNQSLQPPPGPNDSNTNNWYDTQIGVPLELNNLLVLLYTDLNNITGGAALRTRCLATIKYWTPNYNATYSTADGVGEVTGANRVWFGKVIMLRAITAYDITQLELGASGLNNIYNIATANGDDGFYKDGSYIQHQSFAYTGGYGTSSLSNLAEEAFLLSGTWIAFSNTNLGKINNWLFNSFAPLIYNTSMMSMSFGREIAREDAEEIDKLKLVTQAVSLFYNNINHPERVKLRDIAKAWTDDVLTFTPAVSYPINYVTYIDDLRVGATADRTTYLNKHYQYSNMDRVVQRGPGYAFAVSMYDNARVKNYEGRTDYENLRGWHTGSGVTYLYTANKYAYNKNYWPTVDSYRLPGTTVRYPTTEVNNKTQNGTFVGGSSLLDLYGSTAFDYRPLSASLQAKKSYFMLNGKIVCLGAEIYTTKTGLPIETYVEQRKLNTTGSNTFTVNGTARTDGYDLTGKAVTWAHLAEEAGSGIGYCFLGPTTNLKFSILNRTGQKWSDLNVNQNDDLLSNYFMTLWFNHGTPVSTAPSTYKYVILPNKTASQVSAYSANPSVTVLSNTNKVQAVYDEVDHILGANIWTTVAADAKVDLITPSGTTDDYIATSTRCSITMQEQGGDVYFALAEPTTTGGNITVTLKEKALIGNVTVIDKYADESDDAKVTRSILSNGYIQMVFATAGLRGRSLTVKITTLASAPSPLSVNNTNVASSANATSKARMADAPTENATALKVIVMPNPASYNVKLKIANTAAGPMDIRIVNLSNSVIKKVIHQSQGGETEVDVPIADLRGGVYGVTVQQNGKAAQTKLIVEYK
jgi:hyaluronate lyase